VEKPAADTSVPILVHFWVAVSMRSQLSPLSLEASCSFSLALISAMISAAPQFGCRSFRGRLLGPPAARAESAGVDDSALWMSAE
jgi:hypothetical protein